MRTTASFVTSAARGVDFPGEGLPELALVGRSNVGKSSLINALVRQRVARTSAAPGRTRTANFYRVNRPGLPPFLLVDLPGYGYARGGARSAAIFDALAAEYFGRGQAGPGAPAGGTRLPPGIWALFVVDARHPGLAHDLEGWRWLETAGVAAGIVATKVDKLTRTERVHALRALQARHERPVLPVSAETGEGLDDLWTLIGQQLRHENKRPRAGIRQPR